MNMKFENDSKHCALQISWKVVGAWLSRRVTARHADEELADNVESLKSN